MQSLGGSTGRWWAQLWPRSWQCLCVVGSGMHPTPAVGLPPRTCLNYVTPVLLIGTAESALEWQETCLSRSYYGSGGSEPPDIFSSSTWERWTEEVCAQVSIRCFEMLQNSCLLISIDKSLLWWPFPMCVWVDAVRSSDSCSLQFSENCPASCSGLGKGAVADTIFLLSLEFCPLLLLSFFCRILTNSIML